MKAYGRVDVYIHRLLTSGLVVGEWSASCPCRFTPGERAPLGTHWIDGLKGPRAGLDDMEKRKLLTLPGLELRPLGRPARSHWLHRLRYPGSLRILGFRVVTIIINGTDHKLCTSGGATLPLPLYELLCIIKPRMNEKEIWCQAIGSHVQGSVRIPSNL
jgi:hypothetical protein